VTTHLAAPDGFGWGGLPPALARELWQYTLFSHGPADLALDWRTPDDYLAIFDGNTPVNIVPQVPHCAVRLGAMGWADRPATDAELEQMKTTTRAWMEAGATCLCLGLDYQPSAYADTRELVELCKVVGEYGGIYAAHQRYTDLGTAGAWRETIEIGRRADIPVHVSHESVTAETEPLLAEAAERCDLTFESYLYPAGCTHLALMLPIWTQAGGPDALRDRLGDSALRRRIRDLLADRFAAEADRYGDLVFVHTQTGRYVGQTLAGAAAEAGEPVADFAVRVLEEEHPYALMVFHRAGTAEDHRATARRTLADPRMMVASDGMYHGASAHPRGFGCFAQALRLGVRDLAAVTWEEAIFKMSGFPAERFRIKDRGLLRSGYGADLVIFDPDEIADRATWREPRLPPVGIERVIVNGQTVVLDGQPTGRLPGRVLE
jgi:N-acyl-D-amino-acid deacylase